MNEIEDQIKWDAYLIPNTNVLNNKLGITNLEELQVKEKEIVRKKLAYLYLKPIEGNFDLEHLLKTHKFIFEEIYPFAGELRNCSMQKSTMFCRPEEIRKYLEETLNEMNNDFNKDISFVTEFSYLLAKYYYELIYIHPFREGNGRTIRTFIRDFVVEKSKNLSCGPLDLDYTKIDKNNLLLGTARRFLYPSMLETELMKGLVQVEKENKTQNKIN